VAGRGYWYAGRHASLGTGMTGRPSPRECVKCKSDVLGYFLVGFGVDICRNACCHGKNDTNAVSPI